MAANTASANSGGCSASIRRLARGVYDFPKEHPVLGLLAVAGLRAQARKAGLTDITQQGTHIRFSPVDLPESRQVRAQRLYPKTVLKPTVRTMLVPVPRDLPGARPGAPVPPGTPLLRDRELLAWCGQLIEAVFGESGPVTPNVSPT